MMSLPPSLLQLLDSHEKFQSMCFRLARKKYPNAVPTSGPGDKGRDIMLFDGPDGDVAWQCKFTRHGISSIKPKIVESLNALEPTTPLSKWILCVPVDAGGNFRDWLRDQMTRYKFIRSWEVWDREFLLERLEKSRDVLEVFFYRIWNDMEAIFRTEELDLFRYEVDPQCGWKQRDGNVLRFAQANGEIGDLVIDVIVRSRGTIQSLAHSLRVELSDTFRELRGYPGAGLLYPQCTYNVSLRGGIPGVWMEHLEPPLLVEPHEHQRFKVKCSNTGYAWRGYLRLTLLYGQTKELQLPWTFLVA